MSTNRALGLAASGSEYGHTEYYCPEGIPVETALFAILSAFGIAFGVLYRAITMITGMRKRSFPTAPTFLETMFDFSWFGMSRPLEHPTNP